MEPGRVPHLLAQAHIPDQRIACLNRLYLGSVRLQGHGGSGRREVSIPEEAIITTRTPEDSGAALTWAYIGVGSDVLSLTEISNMLGMSPDESYFLQSYTDGDLSPVGRRREGSNFICPSNRPPQDPVSTHLEALLDQAEVIAQVTADSRGRLEFYQLEVVQKFPRQGATTALALNSRWIRTLGSVGAFFEIDQYLDFQPDDDATDSDAALNENVMDGQRLELLLQNRSTDPYPRYTLVADPRLDGEIQERMLRAALRSVPREVAGLKLRIDQTLVTSSGTETGLGISAATLAEAFGRIHEIQIEIRVLPAS